MYTLTDYLAQNSGGSPHYLQAFLDLGNDLAMHCALYFPSLCLSFLICNVKKIDDYFRAVVKIRQLVWKYLASCSTANFSSVTTALHCSTRASLVIVKNMVDNSIKH